MTTCDPATHDARVMPTPRPPNRPAVGSPVLLSDPRVRAIPLRENDEALVRLDQRFGPARALVREGLAGRLDRAQDSLPTTARLRVVEGHRSLADQQAIITAYAAAVRAERPGLDDRDLEVLTSRFVAPMDVAPHPAGAAVDLTLVDRHGVDLDLGTAVDATPEASGGACYFASTAISSAARRHRDLLAATLGAVGLVNYPTEWWHWSFGDRYWALATGAEAATYGPVDLGVSR